MAKAKKLSTGGLNISEGSVVFNNEATELRKTWMQNAPAKGEETIQNRKTKNPKGNGTYSKRLTKRMQNLVV
jgi:hypothetical protein